MTEDDEQELHRLCEILRSIDRETGRRSPYQEVLKKAAFALGVSFINGLRSEIESLYASDGLPLTDIQRAHLLSMGIDPDAPL